MNRIVIGLVAAATAALASSARSQVSIVSSFQTGSHVQDGMWIHRGMNRGYVRSHFATGAIDVVDLASNQVVQSIETVSGPTALSPDERLLAIANPSLYEVVVHRTEAGLSSTRIFLPGAAPQYFVQHLVFPDDRTLFAIASNNSTARTRMWAIDAATLVPSAPVELPPSVILNPFTPLFETLPNRRAVLVGAGSSLTLLEFDAPQTPTSVPVGAIGYDLVFRPDGSTAWLTTSANTVVLVDLESRTVTQSFATGPAPRRLALDPLRGTLVIECVGDDSVQVLDAATGVVLATAPAPGIALTSDPSPLSLLPEAGLALVPAYDADAVHVVDVAPESSTFGTVVQTISLPGCTGSCRPHDVVVSPDGRFGYVLSATRSRVDVLGLPVPPVTVTLVPHGYRVMPGSDLSFDVVVRNSTDVPQPIDAWVDVLRANGLPIPANPVLGPRARSLGAGQEVRRALRLHVRSGVRAHGPFTLRASVGSFPSAPLDTSEIRFVVGP